MFRRKNSRAATHAANAPPASSAASTAAVQAFLASRASSSNLSSAAAAAALRSHTASPTNPASIQTKRMQRRLSNSSNGSAASRPTLQRQGSNGSMTERTFRDSSPLRSSSPAVTHPPIPPIPKNLPKRPKGGMGRPASAEPPERVLSPIPKGPGGRGVSLDRGKVKPKNEEIPAMPKPKPRINTAVAADSSAKRASINFSRPMSPTLSTPSSPMAPANGRVTKPDSKIITPDEVDAIDYSLKNEATSLPSKKKKRVVKEAVEGSHLATGHSNVKPTGTAIDTPAKTKTLNGRLPEQKSPQQSDSDSSPIEKPKSATPKAARPTNKLTKQPSIVREDAEGEAEAEKGVEPFKSRARSTPIATPNGKALTAPAITPTSSQILTPPPSGEPTQRHASPSPARSARFSPQPVSDSLGGVKHNPPPRAMSPAKSALKHSPSPRGTSPALLNNDISDNASVTSEDGKKKRKSVRVSFEESPLVVGQAAESEPSKSPFIMSPQNKTATSRHALNLQPNEDREPDEIISPIPTLPSFGSIRGRRETSAEREHKTLYGDEQARKNLAEMTSSNDHAVGAVIAQAAALRKPSTDPIPPEVRSVEGSGEHSDSESIDDTKDDPVHPIKSVAPVSESAQSQPKPVISADTSPNKEEVPQIAILPATPGHEMDQQTRDSWLSGMPGSFDPQDSPEKKTSAASESVEPTRTDETVVAEPRRESIVEPEPESVQREHSPDSPTVGSIAESLRKHEDRDDVSDSGDSVYSDAAEDPVDLEGDGFGSINAIVDTPIVEPASAASTSQIKGKERALDESPSPTGRAQPTEDWEATKNYWSGINESKKSQFIPDAVGMAISSPVIAKQHEEAPPKVPQPAIPKKSSERTKKQAPAPAVVAPSSAKEGPVPKKSAMKKTVRPTSEQSPARNDVPVMRKTMRGASPGSRDSGASPRSSMVGRLRQDSAPSRPPPSNPRPQSPVESLVTSVRKPAVKSIPPPASNGNTKRMSTMSTKSTAPKQASKPAPKLSRTTSNGSDSSSSFKRERRNRSKPSGAYSMKRSMRDAQPQPQARATAPQDTSPAVRNRPMSVSGVSLRTSMRDKTSPPPRPSSVRVASPSGSFFGRKKKTDDRPSFSRKFSDSSVEAAPTRFSSRFRDSSDEDEPLTPVRGIPRRTIEEDSTDLDDSDVEPAPKPKAVKSPAPPPVASGPALASKSMRAPAVATPAVTNLATPTSPDKKKRSFFGVLGRKKDKSKIGKSELDSPARRDTPLERTKLERSELEYRIPTPEPSTPLESPLDSPMGSPASGTRPGKLQRRSTPVRLTSDSWPLPPPIPADVPTVVRPTTSDGTPARPTMGSRQTTNMTATTDSFAIGRNGKKKRFPMLRKAFGLHD